MVAALRVERQVVASSSPAFRKMAARSSSDQVDQSRRGFGRGRDRPLDVLAPRPVPAGHDVPVVVGHDRVRGLAGADLAAADDERDVDRSAAICLRRAFSSAFSGEPGA